MNYGLAFTYSAHLFYDLQEGLHGHELIYSKQLHTHVILVILSNVDTLPPKS